MIFYIVVIVITIMLETEYNEYCKSIYDINLDYVLDYNTDKSSGLYIGLETELIDNLDNLFSNEDTIILEDFRDLTLGGSEYYTITKKNNNFITIRDMLDTLKNNSKLLKLKHNIDNDYLILTDIYKKSNSNIHYLLFFDDYY